MTASVKSKAKGKAGAKGSPRRARLGKAAILNRRKYAALLSRALPVVITTEAEYDQTISEIKRLLRKGEAGLSPEEDRLLDLLSTLAENWEEARHPIPKASGYRILRHYMRIRGLRQTDLQPILGSRGVTSAIVNRTDKNIASMANLSYSPRGSHSHGSIAQALQAYTSSKQEDKVNA